MDLRLLKADGEMDVMYHKGPIPLERVREAVGGEFEFIGPIADGGVLAVRKDSTALPVNQHLPQFRGDLVLGKFDEGVFVGAMGVKVG